MSCTHCPMCYLQDIKLHDLVRSVEAAAAMAPAPEELEGQRVGAQGDLSPAGPTADELKVRMVVVWGSAVDAHISEGHLSDPQDRLTALGIKTMSLLSFQRLWILATLPPETHAHHDGVQQQLSGINGEHMPPPTDLPTPDGPLGPLVGGVIPQPPRGGPSCGPVAQQLGGAAGRAMDASMQRPGPQDLAAIYYTSGTTGGSVRGWGQGRPAWL